MKRFFVFAATCLAALSAHSLFLQASAQLVPSGMWVPTGEPSQLRAGLAAVLLNDGVVLITGGMSAGGATASVERYDVTIGAFQPAADMHEARTGHTATRLQDGRVLVAGGFGTDGAPVATAEIYDASSNSWFSLGLLLEARAGHTATLLTDGRVVIAGGDGVGRALDSMEVFSPATEQFALVATPMSTGRMRHAAALAGGKVMIIGGWDGSGPVASVDVYDPETDSLSAGPSMTTARAEHSATTLLDGNVLVAGGVSIEGELQSAEVLDLGTGQFSPTPVPMSAPRRNHVALLLPHNNSVLITGGWSNGGAVPTAEVYRSWQDGGTFLSTGSELSGRNWGIASALSFAASPTNRGGPTDGLLLASGGDGATGADLYGFATVKTDRHDYAPGETVRVSGGGWKPGPVTFYVRELPAEHYARILTIDADESGSIDNAELFLVEDHHFGVRFLLTAADGVSQAHMTFTDGDVRVRARTGATNVATTFAAGSFQLFSNSTCAGTGATYPTSPLTTSSSGNGYAGVTGLITATGDSFKATAPPTITVSGTTLTFSSWTADNNALVQSTTGTTGCFSVTANGQVSVTTNYSTDATAPSVTVTSPASIVYSAAAMPGTFDGSAEDNSGGQGLNANSTTFILRRGSDNQYWNGSTWQVAVFNLATTHAATTGNTSVGWTNSGTLPNWSGESGGTYVVQATATDKGGNSAASGAVTFTLDNLAPETASVTAPANGSVLRGTDVPTPGGSAADAAGSDQGLNANSTTLTLRRDSDGQYWNGSGWQADSSIRPTTHIATTGNTSVAWTATGGLPVWTSESDGTYTLQATATDKAGSSFTGTPAAFTLDNTRPTSAIVFPVHGGNYGSTTWSGTLSGTAADSGGIANVKFSLQQGSGNYWNGTAFASASEVLLAAGGTTNWSAAFTFADFPADGTYTLRVKATDTAGNTESTSVSTFTIDTAAPIVSLLTPANGSSSNTTPLFSGVAGTLSGDATNVTVRIYSGPTASGAALQTLPTSRDGAGIYSVAAAALPEGTYTAQTTQTDDAGNTGSSAANTFTIDTTPPVVSLVTPANGSSTNDATPAFSGVAGILAGDGTSVTVKIYNGTDTTGAVVQTLVIPRDGAGAYSEASAALAEGTYTAQTTQTDSAGNTGSSSANTFTIDTTPPVVSLVTPASGSSTNNATPAFSGIAGTLSGDDTSVTVKIYSGTDTTGAVLQTLVLPRDGAGAYSEASAALAEGTYTAQTTQTDSAGNIGYSTANTFTIDTTPPVVSLVTPAAGSSTNDTTPTFSGIAGILTGDAGTVTVKIYSGSDTTGTLVQTLGTSRNGAGAYSVDATALSEGIYTAQTTQADAGGNIGSSSSNTFTIDTTSPVISLLAPANGSSTNDTTPTLSGIAGILAGDNATVTVKIYSGTDTTGAVVQTLNPTRDGSGAYSVPAAALAQGTYTAQTTQGDAAGNTGTSSANTFVVDTTAPVVTNTLATPNPVGVGAGTLLTANVSDSTTGNSAIASAQYSLDGGASWPASQAMSAIDGTFNSPTENVKAMLTLATGVYRICVRGTDGAGNLSAITTDNSANACTLVAVYDPTGGFVTGGGWITSPAGAYSANPALTGRANFGFVSKYQKGKTGASELTGQTEFQFHAGSLNFHSTFYEWLVVAGAKAQYKGEGNLQGDSRVLGFMLTSVDGQVNGGGGIDKFRIKIWDKTTGVMVYDNEVGVPDESAPSTALGGGSIVVHEVKK